MCLRKKKTAAAEVAIKSTLTFTKSFAPVSGLFLVLSWKFHHPHHRHKYALFHRWRISRQSGKLQISLTAVSTGVFQDGIFVGGWRISPSFIFLLYTFSKMLLFYLFSNFTALA